MTLSSIYLAFFTSLSLSLLSVYASQEMKPFFFIDFMDESFLPEPEGTKLEESRLHLGPQMGEKLIKGNEEKSKKISNINQKVAKSNSSVKKLKNEVPDEHKFPSLEGLFLTKPENETSYNQSGNEFLFIEDLLSIFNDTEPEPKILKEEKSVSTVPTTVNDILFELPDSGSVLPLHRMYLKAISSLVQYVMDTLFSFTVSASSRFCEIPPVDYDFNQNRTIKKRDLSNQEGKITANTSTAGNENVTASNMSSTLVSSDVSQGTSEEPVSIKTKHLNETTTTGHSKESDYGSSNPKDELDAIVAKTQDVNLNVLNDSIPSNGTVEHKSKEVTQATSGNSKSSNTKIKEITHNKSSKKHSTTNYPSMVEYEKTLNDHILSDNDPMALVNSKLDGGAAEFHNLHRTARGSYDTVVADRDVTTEFFAITLMIVVVLCLVFGGVVLAFSIRKTFFNNTSPAAQESLECPLPSLA